MYNDYAKLEALYEKCSEVKRNYDKKIVLEKALLDLTNKPIQEKINERILEAQLELNNVNKALENANSNVLNYLKQFNDIDVEDGIGNNLLHIAVRYNLAPETLKYIMDLNPQLLRNKNRFLPNTELEEFKDLRFRTCEDNFVIVPQSPIETAILFDNESAIDLFIHTSYFDSELANNSLKFALDNNLRKYIFKFLELQETDINLSNGSPLLWAVSRADISLIQLLLSKNADINSYSRQILALATRRTCVSKKHHQSEDQENCIKMINILMNNISEDMKINVFRIASELSDIELKDVISTFITEKALKQEALKEALVRSQVISDRLEDMVSYTEGTCAPISEISEDYPNIDEPLTSGDSPTIIPQYQIETAMLYDNEATIDQLIQNSSLDNELINNSLKFALDNNLRKYILKLCELPSANKNLSEGYPLLWAVSNSDLSLVNSLLIKDVDVNARNGEILEFAIRKARLSKIQAPSKQRDFSIIDMLMEKATISSKVKAFKMANKLGDIELKTYILKFISKNVLDSELNREKEKTELEMQQSIEDLRNYKSLTKIAMKTLKVKKDGNPTNSITISPRKGITTTPNGSPVDILVTTMV